MSKPTASPARIQGAFVTEVAFVGGDAPKKIQLFAFGSHKSRDGRGPWTLKDRAHAERVVAATEAVLGSTQMMIDYDHQLPFAALSKNGGQAPAAGWVSGFEIDEAGISATVDWTPQAAQRLADREYRYISPHFDVEKATGLLSRFVNAALVNAPALELAAVASIEDTDSTGDDNMDLKAIAAALGLPEDADIAAITAAIAKRNETMTAVASALGVAADASIETIAAAVATAKAGAPDPAKFVPVENVTAMQTQVASLQTEVDGFKLERQTAAVDAAIEAGKLLPAERKWALDYIAKDAPGFETHLASRVAMTLGERVAFDPTKRPGGDDTLTADERVTCSMIGVSEEDFLAARKAEEAR